MAPSPRFYLIGTKYDRSRDVLPRMLLDGVISTGFVDDLDLKPIIGMDYAAARFAGMKPGDVVALKSHSAPHGSQPRLVIARYAVVAGATKAIYSQSQALGHTLKVDFLDEQEPIELALGYGQTLHIIEDHNRIDLIFSRYAEAARLAVPEAASTKDKATHSSEVSARGAYLMQRTHVAADPTRCHLVRELNSVVTPRSMIR